MSKRHTLTVIIVLGVAVLAVIILLRLVKPKAADENKEVVPDVAVHVGKIIRATLHRYITAYGSVEPEPAGDGKQAAGAFIATPVSGILVQINCTEGRQVSQGTMLFQLDSRVAEVEVIKAKTQLAFAEQQLNSARSELAAAQTQLALLEITAPLTGTLVRLNARLGQSVESNMVLAEIIDLDRLVVTANVPSREAAILKTGQPVELGSGSSAVGTLMFVGKDVDSKNDTILVRAAIPAKAGFQPGQFLSIRIVCEEHRDCLAVPEAAAVSDSVGGETGVIVLVEGDKAVRKPVKIGLREAGLVEVEGEGLKEGMVIVTTDAYAIPGQTKIHIIS
jgi:membrane fusion protein (multidrug efflux system)